MSQDLAREAADRASAISSSRSSICSARCAPSWCRRRRSAACSATAPAFAGFATWLDMTPADPDIFAMPDPDSLIQLPWKPEVGWLAADLVMNGKPVEQAPRNVLKRLIAAAAAAGPADEDRRRGRVLPDQPDGDAIADAADRQAKPCYDHSAADAPLRRDRRNLRRMQALGWQPYQNDHEDANGQFEMNWDYDDALVTADRHVVLQVHGASRWPRSTACARPSCQSRSPI